MTTATLHSNVQRSRFVQHALSAVSNLAFSSWALPLRSVELKRALTPGEITSLEAQKVRDLAYSYSKTDPGFAADLYAAAARHEGLGDEV